MIADHTKRCAIWLALVIAVHPFEIERVLPAPAMARAEIEQRTPHAIVGFLHDVSPDRDRPLRRMIRRSGWLFGVIADPRQAGRTVAVRRRSGMRALS